MTWTGESPERFLPRNTRSPGLLSEMHPRVLVIGLDGAEPSVVFDRRRDDLSSFGI